MTVRVSSKSAPVLRAWGNLPASALCLALVAVAASFALGCQGADFPNAIVNADGNAIHLGDIEAILDDDSLTDFQKDQALEDLGVTDELLRQLLIAAGVGG